CSSAGSYLYKLQDRGNLIKKAKSLVPLLVPLFISAFRRANDLAMAMEARCYRGGDHRTKMKPLHYEKRDYIAYMIVIVYLVCGIAAGKLMPVLLGSMIL
ncbi:MAG: energy-coupling factor transporter transmembrane protein EcfT, partial [Lachnospiraceae bacterium]|nr:energy-coupling factor transporter transmembrane protein EcfT [Lachnospiraceae bacterium]